MKKIIELRRKRAKLIADARALNDQVEGENRSMTQEEQNSWDAMMDEAEELRGQIEREERLLEEERNLEDGESDNGRRMGADEETDPDAGDQGNTRDDNPRGTDAYRDAFTDFLRHGRDMEWENRAILQADSDSGGGFWVPSTFVNRLIKEIDDQVFIRRYANVMRVTNADSLGFPSLENDPTDWEWTAELKTGSEDQAMELGRREFRPHPLAKRIKISNKLLRLLPNIDDFVIERLAYVLGTTQENAFLSGDGAAQPLGIFVPSTKGISTARDVSTDNTTTAVTADGLINAKYAMKQAYWNMARWMFHRDVVKDIAKLKDSDGQYLWRESVRAGEPDRLLGRPIDMSEFAPNTKTTGQYVGILADWSKYWIADALSMTMQRLNELYAETNQTGLIGRIETDGMPILEEAFVRVQLS